MPPSRPFARSILVLCWVSACGPAATTGDGGESPGSEDASVAADAGTVDSGSADAGAGDAGRPDAGAPLGAPGVYSRTPDGGLGRSYDVHVPAGYDGRTPLPVILVLHGGGGDRAFARQLTCPDGDAGSPECLDVVAGAKGFIVVYPDGTGTPLLMNLKTWNAGGGTDGWQCVSGYACEHGVDEASAFRALLTDLDSVVRYDHGRVFATGHSNGGALTHRLACELPEQIAGIAPVAGGNQYATTRPCTAPTPVLEIHGSDDPCWNFDGGPASCADNNRGSKISIPDTLAGWIARNGCTATDTTTALPDLAVDGTTTVRHSYGCPSGRDVLFYEVLGGGHTWPGGFPRTQNGPMSLDFSANRVMVDFFEGIH